MSSQAKLRRWWRQRGRDVLVGRDASALAGECEAFLAGRYASWLVGRHASVPPWVILNRPAHGSVADLRAAHGNQEQRRRPTRNAAAHWPVNELAAHALILADDDPERLSHLQQSILIPLELQLIAEPCRALDVVEVFRRAELLLDSVTPS